MAVNNAQQPPAAAAAALNTDHLPGPGLFFGRPDDRGQDWLQKFELWARCKAYDDNTKVAALALYLQDSASTWHHVLPEAEKDTWPHIRASFLARYGPNLQAGWQRASHLWSVQQQPGESVLDYIAKVQRAARDVNLPDEQQRFAVINGLRPAIRSHVLRQNPVDIAALRQAALLAEQTEHPGSFDDNSLALQRIERQLQQFTLHSLQESAPVDRQRPAGRADVETHYRSPRSPSVDRRPAGHDNFNRSYSRPTSSRSPSYEHRQPPPRGEYDRYDRREQRPYRADGSASYQRPPTPTGQRRVSFAGNDRQAPPSNRRECPPCNSCSGRNHRRSDCYFRDALCTACNRVGHIGRACRSARH